MSKDTLGGIRTFSAMAGAMDRLCEDMLIDSHGLGAHGPHHWHPPTDVFECDHVFVIKLAVSGLKTGPSGAIEGAEVLVEGDTVIIRGERNDHCHHTKRAFFQMEIHYGRFERRVRFTSPFDRDKIGASYRDGFLEVIVPKAQRVRGKPHRIEIQY